MLVDTQTLILCTFSSFLLFVIEKDGKTCLSAEKGDFDQKRGGPRMHHKRHAKHQFAGQNTQQFFIQKLKVERFDIGKSNPGL